MKPRKCVVCDTEFAPNQAAQKSCSYKCAGIAIKVRARMKVALARETIELTCGKCGSKFTTHTRAKKYCSKECSYKAVRDHQRTVRGTTEIALKGKCAMCRDEFVKSSRTQRFCCVDCRREYDAMAASRNRYIYDFGQSMDEEVGI